MVVLLVPGEARRVSGNHLVFLHIFKGKELILVLVLLVVELRRVTAVRPRVEKPTLHIR